MPLLTELGHVFGPGSTKISPLAGLFLELAQGSACVGRLGPSSVAELLRRVDEASLPEWSRHVLRKDPFTRGSKISPLAALFR